MQIYKFYINVIINRFIKNLHGKIYIISKIKRLMENQKKIFAICFTNTELIYSKYLKNWEKNFKILIEKWTDGMNRPIIIYTHTILKYLSMWTSSSLVRELEYWTKFKSLNIYFVGNVGEAVITLIHRENVTWYSCYGEEFGNF